MSNVSKMPLKRHTKILTVCEYGSRNIFSVFFTNTCLQQSVKLSRHAGDGIIRKNSKLYLVMVKPSSLSTPSPTLHIFVFRRNSTSNGWSPAKFFLFYPSHTVGNLRRANHFMDGWPFLTSNPVTIYILVVHKHNED